MQNKFFDTTLIVCAILIVAILAIGPNNFTYNKLNIITISKEKKEPKSELKNNDENKIGNIEKIEIFDEIPLNYKTKEEIYNIRNNAVKKSIFASNDYTPAEEVFGQIEDGKPWLSTIRTKKGNECNISGAAAHSKELVNPSLLVIIDWPYYFNDYSENEYFIKYSLLPSSAKYNKEKKEITVEYRNLPTAVANPYMFNGINARDFGYKYAYIDSEKSINMPNFPNVPNITDSIIEFKDFIHTGGSCGVEGGCNNWSPLQPYLHFTYTKDNYYQNNIIYIKLWKNMPFSKNDPADIVEKIILLPPNH